MSDKMSKEDMVKEAVEEAKAKAAEVDEPQTGQEETAEQDTAESTNAETASQPDAENSGSDRKQTEEDESGTAAQESKAEKEKLYGEKNTKAKKNEKIDELTDRLTRQMAEFDNFRKRTEKEKSQMYEIGAKDIIEKILHIVDNFERGLSAMPEDEKATPFAEGMEKIYKQLMTTLEGIGVKPIEAVGQEFNPDFHNAVMHVEDEELGENIIAEEFQKGYMYRYSVVRHSMVKVAILHLQYWE